MGRLYKINPTCPGCGEEHLYWQVELTDQEQAILDKHTELFLNVKKTVINPSSL